MSPRTVDEGARVALIEAAARLLAQEGPDALTTRRLASEVGASTMVLYTHFEGIDDVRQAVVVEWFARLSEHLARVPTTKDPVADLASQGWAYFSNAVDNEHLFRAMLVDPLDDPVVATHGAAALQVLAGTIQRCMDAGRLRPGDAWARAMQIWMTGTGVLVACLARFVTIDDAIDHFYETAACLLTGFGDDPDAARTSLARGRRRMQRRASLPLRPTAGA